MTEISTRPVQNQYANYSVEELGLGAARTGGPDMAVSNKRPIAEITRCAIRNGLQTAEQMDSRRSLYPGRGFACGPCRVGRDAADETGAQRQRACSHPFSGGGCRNRSWHRYGRRWRSKKRG